MNFIITSLVIALLWGIQPIIQKNLLKDISTQSLMLYSNLIFMFCLLIYSCFYQDDIIHDFQKLTTYQWQMLIFLAVVCSFLTTIVYSHLIKNHKISLVMALTYSAPVFTLILGEILLQEIPSAKSKIGVFITIFGLGIIAMYS